MPAATAAAFSRARRSAVALGVSPGLRAFVDRGNRHLERQLQTATAVRAVGRTGGEDQAMHE
jgi:hypothetical protein